MLYINYNFVCLLFLVQVRVHAVHTTVGKLGRRRIKNVAQNQTVKSGHFVTMSLEPHVLHPLLKITIQYVMIILKSA